ncbi:MAG: VapC toxin family PIN domain ribonuclease [Chloroflexota bacterium]
MVEAHLTHEQALPWLIQVTSGPDTGLIAAHSLAELYAVLTTLPVQPTISPADAKQLIMRNIVDRLEVVVLSERNYLEAIGHLSDLGIVGGATYDALILHSAAKADVNRAVTLNERDFRRVYPELADKIVAP